MKKFFRSIILGIFVIANLFFLGTISFANASQENISHPIAEPAISIDEVISNKITDQLISERYEMFTIEKPQNYTIDASIRLFEYNVSTDYWDNLSSLDYKGIIEKIDYSYPTIYIPVYGDVADSKGVLSKRVIGHLKLSYDLTKKDYRFNISLYNLADDYFKDKKTMWFFEIIEDYAKESKLPITQVFMIRYPSSLSDQHEKIAVIQADTNVSILDIGNTCHVDMDEKTNSHSMVYSVEEYRELRQKVEKTIYQTADNWEKNPLGGNVEHVDSIEDSPQHGLLIALAIGTIVLVGVVGYGVIKLKIKPHR